MNRSVALHDTTLGSCLATDANGNVYVAGYTYGGLDGKRYRWFRQDLRYRQRFRSFGQRFCCLRQVQWLPNRRAPQLLIQLCRKTVEG